MKNPVWLGIALSLYLTTPVLAQPVPPPPAAVATVTISGTVRSYLINPDGRVDGLLLTDGRQLRTPPHLADALQQTARPGAQIRASVDPGFRSAFGQEFRTIALTDTQSNRSVTDEPPVTPPAPPVPGTRTSLSAAGRVERWLVGRVGEPRGFLLADGTQVLFPPHLGATLSTQVKPGTQVNVQGYGNHSDLGTAMELTTLSANGQPIALPTPPSPVGAPVPPPA